MINILFGAVLPSRPVCAAKRQRFWVLPIKSWYVAKGSGAKLSLEISGITAMSFKINFH